MESIRIRHAEPSDYDCIIPVINDWWGGRRMVDMLPRLFFVHFRQTSFVAERNGEIVGFLVGFVSQTFQDEAYIHFVGVHPEFRKKGLGATLYEKFFESAKALNRSVIRCVTSPVNRDSISFHQRMGFSIEPNPSNAEGIPVAKNYDRQGEDRVLFVKTLEDKPQ